ncbi:helix-turn-helix transcriptional regulator [Claveliimonas bilis]|uniref:HTH cro/C1-type domain-containing protein n=1 Tax=Claveliimonas bilis TaxID=3028070 RepID=A0ABN6YYA3_9FIRM|nr:helix-turn-helix transcriptional regulator [Claveliimonas bilis]MCQ5202038.1 helix-turn-helix transcriptional regulator [Mordavella massiliensis]BCZ27805.1 hypothetical protein EUBC25_18920 [Claveliimonas bilis]BDZ78383.1 hypothetical protein Lac1_25660 [Claveliimonas bilis]
MIRLRVLEILREQNHTKYWLFKQMDLSYQNFNRMIMNKTSSIRFENIEKLSTILNCSIDDLFEKVDSTEYENDNKS